MRLRRWAGRCLIGRHDLGDFRARGLCAIGLALALVLASTQSFTADTDKPARRSQAVAILADPLIRGHQQKAIVLLAKHRLAGIYPFPDFVDAAGLMAYGPDIVALFRRAAEYVDKILRGAKPGDLPIEEPTRYVLTVNLKTAKPLGIKIPQSILLRADEVIR